MPSGSSLVSWLCCPGGFFFRSGRFLLRLLVGACFWRPRPQRQGQCLCCCGLRDFTRLRKIGKKVLVPPIIQLLADPATDSQETVVLEAHVQRVAFSLMWLTLSARSGCLDYNHRCSLEIPVFQTQKQNKPPKVPIPFAFPPPLSGPPDMKNPKIASAALGSSPSPQFGARCGTMHAVPSKFQTSRPGHRQCAETSREAAVCISEPQGNADVAASPP